MIQLDATTFATEQISHPARRVEIEVGDAKQAQFYPTDAVTNSNIYSAYITYTASVSNPTGVNDLLLMFK